MYQFPTGTKIIRINRVYHSLAETEGEPEFKTGTWTEVIYSQSDDKVVHYIVKGTSKPAKT